MKNHQVQINGIVFIDLASKDTPNLDFNSIDFPSIPDSVSTAFFQRNRTAIIEAPQIANQLAKGETHGSNN